MPTCLLRSTRTFRKFLCAVKRLPRTSRPSGLGRDSCLRNPLSQYRCHERQSRSAHFSVEPVPLLAPHRSRTLFCLQNTVPGIIHEKCGLVASTTHIETSVAAKRHWIPGVGDEEMRRHSEESTTTKTMPFRRNPAGRRRLRAISLLRAVIDAKTSISVSRRDLARKTHRRGSRYGWYRPLARALDLSLAPTEKLFQVFDRRQTHRVNRFDRVATDVWSTEDIRQLQEF